MNVRMTTLALCVLICAATSVALAAGPEITQLDVFYDGKFSDAADTSKCFLASGEAVTKNITNYVNGITGIRVYFDDDVAFHDSPEDAFTFEWTTGTGTTFSAGPDSGVITITTELIDDNTVVTIVIDDDEVVKRWLKVTIAADKVTAGGKDLNGELENDDDCVDLPSGSGPAGGDAVFYLGNVPGDVDDDRRALTSDLALIAIEISEDPVPITNIYDVDKNGEVQQADVDEVAEHLSPFMLPLISP